MQLNKKGGFAVNRWIVILSAVVMFFVTAGLVGAAEHETGPPFRNGEIVVAGVPGPHLDGLEVAKYLPNADLTVVKVERGKELAMVKRFQEHGRRAGLNHIAYATIIPNDQYYTPYQWNFPAVQAEAAWDISTGNNVIVAVLDTGLAPDGYDRIGCTVYPQNAAGYQDVVNNDNDPDDGDGHGTHVAGTIAQNTNNSIGVAGLAYNSCVMPVKVLDDSGSGSFADIAEGVYYAVANGARVINMSLGTNARYGLRSDPVMDQALTYAYANNVAVVCASGNDGSRNNVSYPAIYPTTIAVGATDYLNAVTRYSNKGEGLDLVAPGGDTSRDRNGDGYGDGILQETKSGSWGYYFFQGTSMAAPHVAAVAAMLIAYDADITPAEIYADLTTTAADLYEQGYDSTSGYGLVQAADALQGNGPTTTTTTTSTTTTTTTTTTLPPSGGTDLDGDGWTVEDGDCDDANSNVYPGHQDSKGRWGRDGVDNDCNGVIDG